MSNSQDEYNKSYALTRGNATHNELHDANRMAEFQATGTFDRHHSSHYGTTAGSANTPVARGQTAHRPAQSTSAQGTQSSGNNAQTLWALVGAGAGFYGVTQTEFVSQFEEGKEWIAFAIAASLGGFLGYKFHKFLSILLAISIFCAAAYFIYQIEK